MSLIDATLNGTTLSSAVPEAVITDVRRPLGGATTDELVQAPGRDGAWVFAGEPADAILQVSVSILVDAPTERRAAIQTLRAWARTPDGRAPLILSDESDRYWDVVIVGDRGVIDDETAGQTVISFSARPYAYSTTQSTESVTADSNPDSGTFSIDDGFAAEPVIEITPSGGGLTGFTLTINGDIIAWEGVLGTGETLTISTISQTVTLGSNDDLELTGAFNTADVDMATVSASAFPELSPGSNSWAITWDGAATSVDVDFTWRERFI